MGPAGGCPEDCYIPYVKCPIPLGSLSMCGGTPRGQCMTSSGQCSCNTGYSGVDCGSCALDYSREGVRCVLEGQTHSGCAFSQCPSGNAFWRRPFGPCHSPCLQSCYRMLQDHSHSNPESQYQPLCQLQKYPSHARFADADMWA